MIKMRPIFLILIIPLWSLTGCKKDNSNTKTNSKIEFYLLKSFKKVNNSSRISNDSLVLNDTALIKDSEIISYDKINYSFKISDNKANWLNDFQANSTHGRAFAITIDKTVIYTGYFWASFSSSIVDWIVIDPINYSGQNKLSVKLGYPGLLSQMDIPDLRNDKRIVDLMSLTNRLIE